MAARVAPLPRPPAQRRTSLRPTPKRREGADTMSRRSPAGDLSAGYEAQRTQAVGNLPAGGTNANKKRLVFDVTAEDILD